MIRRFFSALWNFLKTPWVVSLLIILVLVLLIWLLGPLVAVADTVLLESVTARLIATCVLMFCWGLFVAVYHGRKRKLELADPEKAQEREKEVVSKLRLREELDHVRDKVKACLKTVTRSNFYGPKSRSRYALPWYMMLGTTNSGKTSLLLNSGLKFPLNEQADRHLYQLKATERMDVLYGNEAIFFDLPGSYTESLNDTFLNQMWHTVLRRLFRSRPARPVNGIIMCVSMRDIMDTDATKREHLARTIRARLSDVLRRLRSYVPVYLVFTKCDAVPGFGQFFAHLSRNEREQIFGCLSKEPSMQPGMVRSELKALMETLNAQIISKIHQERDLPSRGDMFRFPQELATLGPRMEDFIAEAFGPSRYHKPVMFRGFFFTSALSSRDVMASTARQGELGFQTGFNPSVGGDYAKGFFLLRLLQDCIIPEARLADADREQIWALRLRRYGLQIAAAVLFLVCGSAMGVSFVNNYSGLETMQGAYAAFAGEQARTRVITDAREALPELEKIRQATEVFDPENDSFLANGLGLYQGKRFNQATHEAYLGTLNTRFLPAIRAAAREKVERSMNDINALKPALRAYLMLHNPEHMNARFLKEWLSAEWSDRYLGQADVQKIMHEHMDYLVAHGIVPAQPENLVVERARKSLLSVPLPDLAYQRMQEEAAESGLAPYTFHGALGTSPFDGDTYKIPGLYTRAGYEEYLIKRAPGIIRSLTNDSWILGTNPLVLSNFDVTRVHRDVRAMYFRDYIRHWGKAVQELSIRTPARLGDAQNLAEQMTGGVSPVVAVIREIRANTDFVLQQEAATNEMADKALEAAGKKVGQKVGQKLGKAGKAAMNMATASLEDMRAQAAEEAQRDALAVRQYFAPLDSLLDAEGNPRPELKAADEAMAAVRDYITRLNNADNVERRVLASLLEIADEKDDTLRTLEATAAKLPAPLRGWYSNVSTGTLRRMLVLGANSINNTYRERVFSVYQRNLASTYPFNAASDTDANLEEFASFFRAGGTLDNFHDAYLKPFVTRNGQMRSIMGRSMPISSQSILALQRANQVQDAFFLSGREPGITFLMEPYALDSALKQVTLVNEGKTLVYQHGPVNGESFTWPGGQGASGIASLETQDLSGITTKHLARGDWALFRVLKGATIKRQSGNTCLVEVHQNGKWAQFLIQFRNKANPFDPKVCSFTLPDSLI